MAVALAFEGAFGFALQTTKGTFAAPDNWLPLMDAGRGAADTVTLHKNYVPLDLADMKAYQTDYFSAGQWVEGELRFPLIPGTLTDLLSWIQSRDSNNQGTWASAVIDCANVVKQITDLKVRRATFDFAPAEPVLCTLEVVGLALVAGTAPTVSMPTTAPYLFREAALELTTGGTAAADGNCERLRVVVDTCLEAPEKGLRLTAAPGPVQLYNLAGVRAGGSFSRDLVDNAVYTDFLAGTEAALTVTVQRGEIVAELQLPRLLHTADALGLPGSHERRIVEEVQFLALGSVDGTTPPVTLI
jgi:hypothetical protein